MIMASWLLLGALLVAGAFWPAAFVAAAAAFVAPIVFLWMRRGTLAGGIYSFVAWNVTTLGIISGITRARVPAESPIDAVVLKSGHEALASPLPPPQRALMNRTG
jgi:hypothetical protein